MKPELAQTRAAEALFEARETRRPIAPVSETFGIEDVDAAYAVQEANTRRWLAAGRRLVGRKIGLTSEAVQRQLGVDQPDYGMLFDDTAYVDGAAVPIACFLQPRVEAEIAFDMRDRLDDPGVSRGDVERAVGAVRCAVEIVDSAIADWRISLADTIADNASGGGFVLGATRRALGEVELPGVGMTLVRNGERASAGVGAACLGDPLEAVVWLARRMAAVGRPLAPGDVVLSGALGPIVDAAAGDRFDVELEGLGSLHLSFV